MTTRSDSDAVQIVDARGQQCPWPVLRAAKAMREASVVELIADDPVAERDVPALAEAHQWSCDTTKFDNITRFLLRKPPI